MWSAAILAGGLATRFGGRDKGALIVEGESIQSRQFAALAQVADDLMIVGPDRSAVDNAIGIPVRTLPDRIPGRGPLGGLHTALSEARGDALAVVACDMPFVSAPLLAHLLALTREADAVVPSTGRGYHPLCAAYTRACLDSIARRLSKGELKMIGWLDEVRVRVVPEAELRVFGDPDALLANVNTPDDFLGLEAHQGHEL
jgi:molybdenum cofactor guanylyltransferase